MFLQGLPTRRPREFPFSKLDRIIFVVRKTANMVAARHRARAETSAGPAANGKKDLRSQQDSARNSRPTPPQEFKATRTHGHKDTATYDPRTPAQGYCSSMIRYGFWTCRGPM